MSKNSPKQNIEQLLNWLPTLSSHRKKRVKSRNNGQRKMRNR